MPGRNFWCRDRSHRLQANRSKFILAGHNSGLPKRAEYGIDVGQSRPAELSWHCVGSSDDVLDVLPVVVGLVNDQRHESLHRNVTY